MPITTRSILLPFWRRPTPPPLYILKRSLCLTLIGAGHNLLVGFSAPKGGILWPWFVWTALTGLSNLVGITCIPTITFLQRRGWFLRSGFWGWAPFYFIIASTSLLGSYLRTWLGSLLLPGVVSGLRGVGLTINLGISIFLIIIIAEWFQAHLDMRAESDRLRQRLASEAMAAQQEMVATDDRLRQGFAEILHGEIQSYLLLAWIHLKEAQKSAPKLRSATEKAIHLLAKVRHEDLLLTFSRLQAHPHYSFLEESLDDLVQRFEDAIPIQMEWSLEARELSKYLSNEEHLTLIRVIEECLLNALRHASPHRLHISAECPSPGLLRFVVLDDGRGFFYSHSVGLGMKMLEEKILDRGGSWNLQSIPGKGTTITFDLPLSGGAS